MAKRVFIGVGHGGRDPGAVKYVKEADANLTIALELRRILTEAGVTVGISRVIDENDTLTEEIKEANSFKPDLAIDVHNNAGGGNGFEVLIQTNQYAAQSKAAALAIEKAVRAQGQNSRGLKIRKNSSGTADYYGFLRSVKCPAVIVEGFFVDNYTDAKDYDTKAEQRELAAAYAQGILNYLGVKVNKSEYQVNIHNCSALNIRSGPGTSYGIVGVIRDKKIYTIVEEKNGWGRLKSGAGFISLAYTKRV